MTLDQLTYAGNLSPEETWKKLQDDTNTILIDVRTPEEWAYVGVVNLSPLGRECLYVPWLTYPRMSVNPNFVPQILEAAKPQSDDTPILFICRSGVRSAYAAHALTDMGYTQCYNVAFGFEGDQDENKHRGNKNGWKVAGLPWFKASPSPPKPSPVRAFFWGRRLSILGE
ncbi:MAG: rhodanese-like domain-containing protein [Magnetovibrio sp.]|nr:rhodanese-like domain-containing protein [Magnetovibrio sp.]